jgi:hypothetical protein
MSKERPVLKIEQPQPTPRQQAAIARAAGRFAARRSPVAVAVIQDGNTAKVAARHADADGHIKHLLDSCGTASFDFAETILSQLTDAARRTSADKPNEARLNAMLAVLDGIAPRDELEAMLAAQMAITHDLAMDMAGRAKRSEYVQTLQDCGNLSVKLLRTFTLQVEALAKLRRGGVQKVTVEHVHVHAGGQAIVGAVSTGGGGILKSEDQPHAIDHFGGEALPGADASRDAMPVPSNAERAL